MQAAEIHCSDHSLIRIGQTLYTFGKNTYGQLFRGVDQSNPQRQNYDDDAEAEPPESQTSRATPLVPEAFQDRPVFCCAVGFDFSLALRADGLYLAGRFLRQTHQPPARIPFFNGRAVRLLSSGPCADHLLVHCDDGLFAMGSNGHGQLGLGDTADREVPQEVVEFHARPIDSLATGYGFSLVLAGGVLYSFGLGSMSGTGSRADQLTPTKVAFFEGKTVKRIACGRHSSLVLCDAGLFQFGQAVNCQHVVRHLPQRLDFFDARVVTRLAVGVDHYLVLCNDDELYSFGRNLHGELGHGDTHNTTEPKLVAALRSLPIDAIAAGPNVSMVLTGAGELYAFGDPFDGRLGMGVYCNWHDRPKYLTPTPVPAFTAILQDADYGQLRLQPLALVPGVLTQGSKPALSSDDVARLQQHEQTRQQELAEEAARREQELAEREATDAATRKQEQLREEHREREYERMEKDRAARGEQLPGSASDVLVSEKAHTHTDGSTLQERVQREVEDRLRRLQPDVADMEDRVRQEIEARAREGKEPLDPAQLRHSPGFPSREYHAEDAPPPTLEAKVTREVAALMQSRGASDLSAEDRIRAQVADRVRSEVALAKGDAPRQPPLAPPRERPMSAATTASGGASEAADGLSDDDSHVEDGPPGAPGLLAAPGKKPKKKAKKKAGKKVPSRRESAAESPTEDPPDPDS
eukprot:EG_transcript_4077